MALAASRKIVGADDSLSSAEKAWADARYEELIEASSGSDSRLHVLAAHAAIRRRRYDQALEIVSKHPHDKTWRSRLSVLERQAAYRSSKDDKALAEFSISVPDNSDAETVGLAKYFSASNAWMIGSLESADRLLDEIDESAGRWVEALSLSLRGWLDIRRGRFTAASRRFLSALDALKYAKPQDAYLRMNVLFGLSWISAETIDMDLASRVMNECTTLPLSPELAKWKSLTMTFMAICSELLGIDSGALDYFVRSQSFESTEPFLALSMVEWSAFHKRAGEARSAKLHLERAQTLLSRIDWSTADIEARVILLRLAIELAPYDTPAASSALIQASSYTGKRDDTLAFQHDERAQALANYTYGQIALHNGDMHSAAQEIGRAARIWSTIGYRFRAAEAESVLLRLSGPNIATPNLDAARRETPKAWFVIEQNSPNHFELSIDSKDRPEDIRSELGPAERKVLDLICAGFTSKEIAAKVGRSPSTVRNQTIRIFRAFGISDRKLLAQLFASRGNAEPVAAASQQRSVRNSAANDLNRKVNNLKRKRRGMKKSR